MSQESSLVRSWEFVSNQDSQSVQNESSTETVKEMEPVPPAAPLPEATMKPPSNPLVTRISALANDIISATSSPSYSSLEFLKKILSPTAFTSVLQKIIEDAINGDPNEVHSSLRMFFETPPLTVNSTEQYKELCLSVINSVFPALLNMNAKNAAISVAILSQLSEKYHQVMRSSNYRDMFFVNQDFLCTGNELGRGKFATVYEGRHTGTGQKLAIKMMDKQKLIAEDPRVEEFLQRETAIMKSLNHPSVVRLYEVLDTPTSLFLIMEFCPGGTLADYLQTQKQIPEQEAQVYIRQIASGLQYMRARNIAHRDLKPANLLLVHQPDGSKCLKITDFTFARFLKQGEISKTLVGSPLYMAPEIFNDYQYDGVADLWSVGVILYEMLVGQVPFPAETLIQLINVLRTTDAAIPSNIKLSNHCQHLVLALLQKDAKRRIPWDAFFNHPWLLGTVNEPARPNPISQAPAGRNMLALIAENKELREKEESMKTFIQDQQRFMQDQNSKMDSAKLLIESMQNKINQLTSELKKKEYELSEANDTLAAYKIAFADSVNPFITP